MNELWGGLRVGIWDILEATADVTEEVMARHCKVTMECHLCLSRGYGWPP